MMFCMGTRPEIIKMAPLIKECEKRGHNCILVWSGQHYDKVLFESVFDDLGVKYPQYNLNAKGTPCEIGSIIFSMLEKIIKSEAPDIVFVHGDTFSALFCSIASALALVPVGHVEAGLRTNSWEPFPEQICTRSADAASSLYFAPTMRNVNNLLSEGYPRDRIFLTGNTIVDAVRIYGDSNPNIRKELGIPDNKKLIFFSAHRRENTMDKKRMSGIFDSLLSLEEYTIFCAVLPGTQKAAETYGYLEKLKNAGHIIWKYPSIEKYTDVLSLIKRSDLILTDSGGLQEEGASLHVPCLTLRYVTDRPETVISGSNKCIGFVKEDIVYEVIKVMENADIREKMVRAENPYGDGYSSKRIADIVEHFAGRLHRWENKIKEVV
ncbi:MAG: non-hydrolyzing UDP-N-acetylglucosamine 2-epimerase [Candidatus Micrarchaeia archaeon]